MEAEFLSWIPDSKGKIKFLWRFPPKKGWEKGEGGGENAEEGLETGSTRDPNDNGAGQECGRTKGGQELREFRAGEGKKLH